MKIACITGTSHGLGQALGSKMAKEGWKVLGFSRTGKGADEYYLDLSDPVSSLATFAKALDEIDLQSLTEVAFINNACVLSPIDFAGEYTPNQINQGIHINLLSPIQMINHFINVFKHIDIKKVIINISSGAALRGYPGWSLYCTAKAGIENYFKTLYDEQKYTEFPFTVCNFDPNVMDTSMQSEIRNTSVTKFPIVQKFQNYKNEGRLLNPELVGNKLFYLLNNNNITNSRYDVVELL